MKAIGFAGWSGAGKTTLIERVIPALRAGGLSVSTIKHVHHKVELDTPGKDSWRHRQAGAGEVLVISGSRWALMHEIQGDEPPLEELLARMSPVDLVLIEGFKTAHVPKIEVFRAANGKPSLYPDDPHVVAIAADTALADTGRPVVALDDIEAVADLVRRFAKPIAS
ncbi:MULTISPECIES: molybdopterin-guanine dinucleotide biosynthesis protein B [unclassified Beijerinckia]|uniref:molybdopterin-guanine dinucleotide biosynthesis protein B n=1 Tax=unclassified Beijerinckia TaxID=2638183 RepID=UPI0008987EFB|nr:MULTISPECIES: molybdopterin-guanine dinucleotide biosynthesis protein B [unclassified Beijerinckia]MDH7795245.1 molybdopterin-guanine dinucleotide biosynthesis protein B [Beijerinckia sp. GAS462]SEB93486.1 molybdopterin guanine dinucleotide biosynthesis accessory protein MobB [Beijerinckia sp. 28-YEA-48]